MSDAGPRSDSIEIDAENWPRVLLPDLPEQDVALLGPDRDVIFDALIEVMGRDAPEGVVVSTARDEPSVAADAALLLPGARLHVQTKEATRHLVQGVVRIAALLAISGNEPGGEIIGLSVALASQIIEKASRLDAVELEIAAALASLQRSGSSPTEADLEELLPEVSDLGDRLSSLRDRGVVSSESSRWRLTV